MHWSDPGEEGQSPDVEAGGRWWTGVLGVLWPLCEVRGSARRPLPPPSSHCLPVPAFLTDGNLSAWIPHANVITAANYMSLLLPRCRVGAGAA